MKLKKIIAIVLCMVTSMTLVTGCGKESNNTTKEETTEIVVFAAASMTETLDEIINNYEAENKDVKVIATYDSSGTLATQIIEGAEVDLFISASEGKMNVLDINADETKNPDKNDFVNEDTRKDILENKVVLVVPTNNTKKINKFSDISKADLIALGNEDVPVGSYSLELLGNLNIDIATLESEGKVTYGSDVKAVTSYVSENAVDCGIVYATDAFSANLTVVDTADETLCSKCTYPAAIMKNSKNEEAAKDFLEYIQNDESKKIFENVGFTVLD